MRAVLLTRAPAPHADLVEVFLLRPQDIKAIRLPLLAAQEEEPLDLGGNQGALTDVLWDGVEFVAVGYDLSNASKALILSSTDGVTWTSHAAGNLTNASKIGLGANKLAILTSQGLATTDFNPSTPPVITTQPAQVWPTSGRP